MKKQIRATLKNVTFLLDILVVPVMICGLVAAGSISSAVVLSDGSIVEAPPVLIPAEANHGAFEGGPTDTKADAGE
jgi:hypothetical protein